ncbi:hypothetical protein BC831DRAFT_461660, partial [Entophlyctis helioformis]
MRGWQPPPPSIQTIMSGNPITQEDKARIMSAEAGHHGGQVPAGSWGAHAQSYADKGSSQGASKGGAGGGSHSSGHSSGGHSGSHGGSHGGSTAALMAAVASD